MTTATKRILVTGARGYIGNALTRALVQDGHDVSATLWSRKPTETTAPGAIALRADVCSHEDVRALSTLAITRVYQLAAPANARGTLNLLEFARCSKLQRFVFVSSVAVLDPSNQLLLGENASVGPWSPYGAPKLGAEAYSPACHRCYGAPATIVRLTNVYERGFTRYSAWDITNKVLKSSTTIPLLGSGEQVWDFIYLDDATRGIICVGECGRLEVYHLARGCAAPLNRSCPSVGRKATPGQRLIQRR